MSYPKKLLKLRPARGIVRDTPAHEVGPDYWTGGQNVQMRKGFAGRIRGRRAVYGTLPVDVLALLNARIATTNYWLVAGADELHALETSNTGEVTPAAGLTAVTSPHELSFTLLNGVPCFTNGIEAPHYWPVGSGITDPFVALPDWPAGYQCKYLVGFQNHLFALNLTTPSAVLDDSLMWSDVAAPGSVPSSWTPAADNEAGDPVALADTPGPILQGLPMRGSLLVYKRSGTYGLDYVRDPDQVFTVRTLFTSSGVLTPRGACDLNGRHFVVTDGDCILTDGTNRQSAAQGRMKDALFSQLDQNNYLNLFTAYHRAANEVWVCFPEAGSTLCTKALIYDVANDGYGERDLDNVACAAIGLVNDAAVSEDWDDDAGAWDDDVSKWNTQNFSFATESIVTGAGTAATMHDTDDAVSLPALIAKHDMDFGDAARVKQTKTVHVRKSSGAGTLYVRLGARMTTDDAIAWSTERALEEGEQELKIIVRGRYISCEVRSEDDDVWTVTGIDIEAELRGYY